MTERAHLFIDDVQLRRMGVTLPVCGARAVTHKLSGGRPVQVTKAVESGPPDVMLYADGSPVKASEVPEELQCVACRVVDASWRLGAFDVAPCPDCDLGIDQLEGTALAPLAECLRCRGRRWILLDGDLEGLRSGQVWEGARLDYLRDVEEWAMALSLEMNEETWKKIEAGK